MYALSLWQPWADLIAMGLKTMETRFWSTEYRGPILICSAKTMNPTVRDHIQMFADPDVWRCGFEGDAPPLSPDYKPRLGMALCVARITDCIELSEQRRERDVWRQMACFPDPYTFEGWSLEGRYGFVLENIEPIRPFPVVGRQKIFHVDYGPDQRPPEQRNRRRSHQLKLKI